MGKDIKELLSNFFTAVTHKLIILSYSLRLHYIRDFQTFIKMQFLLLLKTSSILYDNKSRIFKYGFAKYIPY